MIMRVPGYVSISRPISPYIESLLRVEFPEDSLLDFVRVPSDRSIPRTEREPIESFIAGINAGRLEIHGSYMSNVVRSILAHLSTFDIASDFEFFLEEMARLGPKAAKRQWADMDAETRSNVFLEACFLECIIRDEYRKILEYGRRDT